MKRMWTALLLCAALLGGCAAGGTAGGGTVSGGNVAGGASISDAGEGSETVTETVSQEPAEDSSDAPSNAEYPAQSREEAETRLQALQAEHPYSLYPFLQAVASGELAPDAHRLDAETAKRILADAAEKHTDGETVYKQLEQEQVFPDHLWGFGMDYRVYWLDGVGDEQLEVCNATTFTYIPSGGEPVLLYNAIDAG